jgi:flagellar basal-body rod protein FlgC
MSLLQAIKISASGLVAERARLEVAVENLANAHTTRTVSGGPYRRRDVVFQAYPMGASFAEELDHASATEEPLGVRVSAILHDPAPPMRVYDPGHPDADAEGYVSLPNVNPVEEMVNIVSAARSFESNLTAITMTRELVERSIELGRA